MNRTNFFPVRQGESRNITLDSMLVRVGCVLALIFILGGGALLKTSFAAEEASLAEETEMVLCGKASPLWHYFLWQALPEDSIRDPNQRYILFAYQKRDWQPVFFDSGFRLTSDALIFIDKLKHLKSEAINPAPYQVEELLRGIDKIEQLRPSLRCSAPDSRQALLQPAQIEGRDHYLNPSGVAGTAPNDLPSLAIQSPAYAPGKELEQGNNEIFRTASAIEILLNKDLSRYAKEMSRSSHHELTRALCGEISVTELLAKLEPNSPHYASVLKAFTKYDQLTHEHRFKALDLPKLKLGSKGYSVRQLQKRLSEEGFLQGETGGSFDAMTKQAVRKFQLAHQLDPDGVVGDRTKAALNVPYEEKLKMITKALKLLRESQSRSYERFVRINIPQFTLEYYKEKKISGTYRVIVGKSSGKVVKLQEKKIGINQTPALTSAIQQVIFNPRWYVSDRIRLELNDAVQADPNYFARNGYVAMSLSYPWGEPRLYQRPGPKNPLGRVKFEFPNSYAVYLHDTPAKQLFQQIRRDFSHGCIRLENAINFAQTLLSDDENHNLQKVERYLASERQVFVRLTQPVPIIIEYVPVSSDGKGQVIFCGDPYGWLRDDTG